MILDFIVIIIFASMIITGYKTGVAKMLLKILSSILSYLVASFLGQYLSQLIYNNYIYDSVISGVSSSLSSQTTNGAANLDALPFIAKISVRFAGFDTNNALQTAIKNAPNAIAAGVESAIRPVVISFLSFALTLLLLIVLSFLLRFTFVRTLSKVFTIPGLRWFNKLLGSVCGFITAALLVTFLAYLLHILIPYVNHMPYVFSESQIYNSYIFYHFYSGNIINSIISII